MYFLAILGISHIGNVWSYIMNITFIAVLFAILFISKRNVVIGKMWPLVLLLMTVSLMSLVFKEQYLTFVLFAKVVLLVYFIKHFRISERELIRFVNTTYLFYVLISILFYVFLPGFIYDLKEGQNNLLKIGGFSLRMLQSIEGSASSLDSYSSLVLVMNLSFSKWVKKWKFYALISFTVLLWTFRLTPMVGLFLALVGALFVRSGKASLIFLGIFVFAPFLIGTYIYRIDLNYAGYPLRIILNTITHNRFMIWDQQLQIFYSNYRISDYILGNFSSELFSIQAFQTDGSLKKGYFIDNPHNSYLYLLFSSPFLFAIALSMILRRLWINYDARWWPVLVVVFVGAVTNGQLLTLQNPIPLIILIFYFVKYSKSYKNYAFR